MNGLTKVENGFACFDDGQIVLLPEGTEVWWVYPVRRWGFPGGYKFILGDRRVVLAVGMPRWKFDIGMRHLEGKPLGMKQEAAS